MKNGMVCTAKCDRKDCPYREPEAADSKEKIAYGDLSYTTVCRKED